eukprot:snap_masked-scaffold_7-processed-gene-15.35-mRNA-1 protein AED:1.00 eAED:1.00 QI:0/-1/0/0/-1/1/1/0/61
MRSSFVLVKEIKTIGLNGLDLCINIFLIASLAIFLVALDKAVAIFIATSGSLASLLKAETQ